VHRNLFFVLTVFTVLELFRWRRAESCQDGQLNGHGGRKGARARHGYRRRKLARERAALAAVAVHRNAVLDRLEWQLAELRASLDKCAAAHAVMVRELAIS